MPADGSRMSEVRRRSQVMVSLPLILHLKLRKTIKRRRQNKVVPTGRQQAELQSGCRVQVAYKGVAYKNIEVSKLVNDPIIGR